MLKFLLKSSLKYIFVIVAVAACTPSYVNTDDLGEGLKSQAEVRSYVEGKFIPNGRGGGYYYAPNGTSSFVETKMDQIATGRWFVTDDARARLCIVDQSIYYREGARTVKTSSPDVCFWIYPQSDGSAKWDRMGGGNLNVGPAVSGFPLKARFDALRAALLGS